MTMNGIVYLASPYTHPNEDVREARFLMTEAVTAKLMTKGLHIFSPIVHCHALAKRYSMPTDYMFWLEYNRSFLKAASTVCVFTLPGWEDSKGVAEEIRLAIEWGKQLQYVDETGRFCEQERKSL